MPQTTGKDEQSTTASVEIKSEKVESENPHFLNIEMFMPTEPIPERSFYGSWGHQAILTYLIGKAAVKRLYPLVPHTLIPIVKLCSDNPNDVEAAFKTVQGFNETIRFFDSPYEKYRKIYGRYIREIEWCCFQLRKYFTKRAFENLIIESTFIYVDEILGKYIEKMQKMMSTGITREKMEKGPGKWDDLINKILTKIFDFNFGKFFNITGWLGGDVEVSEYNFRTGLMVMNVKDCLMLRAPRMRQLPEDTCLFA